MKLVRYGEPGIEKPGIVGGDGRIHTLYPVVQDWEIDVLTPDALKILSSLDVEKLPLVPAGTRLGCPLANVRQIVAVGLNFRDHAQEAGLAEPTYPMVFHKAISSISGPGDHIMLPPGALRLDWEVELGVVIGRTAKNVAAADASQYIVGYCVTMDVSERNWQMNQGGLFNIWFIVMLSLAQLPRMASRLR